MSAIEKISFYTPPNFVDLADLAMRKGEDKNKYLIGIEQERFSLPFHDEDIITMAANAAQNILSEEDKSQIDTLILATETGIDQSKAAAIYVHKLLNLPSNCRCVELKQACYSASAGLIFADSYLKNNPDKKVLLIATDIAHYEQNSPAEATQGAGAVAMLLGTEAKIAKIIGKSGIFTKEVMDFWRPNDHSTPLVNGKLSTLIYINAAEAAYLDFAQKNAIKFADFSQYCYHLPFGKMGIKAHKKLCAVNNLPFEEEKLNPALIYGRQIGNVYTASLYLSLISALDNRDDLGGKKVAMLSYGSGCVSEFFALEISPNYQEHRLKELHQKIINNRKKLSLEEYDNYWHRQEFSYKGGIMEFANEGRGGFRLGGIFNYERQYL